MAIMKTFAAMVVVGIVVFIGLVTAGGMAVYSKQSSFCASCKIMQTRYVAWERSTHARSVHAKADCINCHSEPGIIGEFKAHMNGARYVFERVTGGHQGAILGAKVFTRSCEECHKPGDIVVKQAGHHVNHAAHMAHKIDCVQCHRDIAHGTLLGQSSVHPMETCATCHTQQQFQMGRCVVCHPRNMIDNLFLAARTLRAPM